MFDPRPDIRIPILGFAIVGRKITHRAHPTQGNRMACQDRDMMYAARSGIIIS